MIDKLFPESRAYVSTHDVARIVGVTGDYLARLAKAGRIQACRICRNWYVDREAIRTMFNSGALTNAHFGL
jgi:hypothetical protein